MAVRKERAIIVGGGIGGLAAAVALDRAGFDVAVLEQAGELREIGAAIGVQTNAVRALRHLGLAEQVIEQGVPIEFYEYHSWRGRRLVRWSQGDIGRALGEPTVVVHRAQLQQVLARAAPGVRLGQKATGFEQDAGGVTVGLADGSEVRGSMLVGADGLRSLVRAELVGDGEPRYSGWAAYRAVTEFSTAEFPVGHARQTLGAGCSFGMWHLPGGRVYWVATIKEPEGLDVPPARRKAHVLARFGSAHAPIRKLIEATPDDTVLRNAVSDRVPVDSWSSGRVVLLGDAAHPTTPVTGQGGGQAIIDAHVLGDELARTGGGPFAERAAAAFAAYQRRRMPVTTEITNEAWFIARMHHFSNRLAVLGRDLSLWGTPARTWNRRMETRLAF
ncbi:FAD-dependent monooxygenase [Actinomadura napierensis]|uniref:NAD(P)/FAD-dependent oxidoreductase n=1 Tax=Actinomadura napierensis TaxID=267854 RepID=A0ABN2ZY54_9ACTN